MTDTTLPGKTEWESQQYRADGGMHARLAQALDDAAQYIRTHPDLPIPAGVEINYHVPAGTDKDGEDELHRIAAMIAAPVTGEAVGYARKDFGPVRYTASYITQEYGTAYSAHMATFTADQAARRAAVTDRVAAIKDIAAEQAARIRPRGEAA